MTLGRMFVLLGLAMAAVGVLMMVLQRADVPFGRLPGDIRWRRGNLTVYFPVVTCVLLSLAGTLLLWLFGRR